MRVRISPLLPERFIMQRIVITDFVKTQVDKEILDLLPRISMFIEICLSHEIAPEVIKITNGFYPFSKIVSYPNVFEFKTRLVKITPENQQYLTTDYVTRASGEIPYLRRFFRADAPVEREVGKKIDIILYTADQLAKEGSPIDGDWGIVAVNVEMDLTTPVQPVTMINNALGIEFGGNGEPLDKEKYLESVSFWKEYALVSK